MRPEAAGAAAAPSPLIAGMLSLSPAERARTLGALGIDATLALDASWPVWAHDGQRAPEGDWATWVIKAGRGFGKTRAGAEWIAGLIAGGERIAIALVGATLEDARRVMVEGRSGLLAVAGEFVTRWHPSMRTIRFTTGAEATLFSGASPDMLRGPEHHFAWCDELAKWDKAQECWDMLQLGLRLGDRPRALVTTTPRPGPVLRAIMAEAETVTTGGSTHANPHLSRAYRRRVDGLYAGTRLGRQEIDGELLADAAGALWTVELLERCRVWGEGVGACGDTPLRGVSPEGGGCGTGSGDILRRGVSPEGPPRLVRTLIAVDPPSGEGTCGIVACARDAGGIGHVLADHSVTGRSPEGWARAVAHAAAAHGTREVVAEANQGGRMVKAVLLTADAELQVRLATATKGKSLRAEPVAHLFEAGKVRLHGRLPELEAQLLGMIAGGGYEGPGVSPDRADAMVWGVVEVMRDAAGPRVREV